MKKITFFRRVLKDERGQMLVWAAMTLALFLGVGGGLSVDLGRAYILRSQLQNIANASALAASTQAYYSSSTTGANQIAATYGPGSGDENANVVPATVTVTPTITPECLNSLMPSGSSCTSSTSPVNAVRVQETATIPTYLMAIFGKKSLTVTAFATASMQGKPQPWNVAIILDTTGSMATKDSNCASVTEFQCAANALELMLAKLNPCPNGTANCTTPDFNVALFTFPGVTTSSVKYDVCGSSGTPSQMEYTLPIPGATSYTPITYTTGGSSPKTWTATYEVTLGASDADANGFVNDYYNAAASNGLNSTSSIVQALGGCLKVITSLQSASTGSLAPNIGDSTGGIGVTYYASVIYAAQAALTAEQKLNANSKNAIIFLSDGQANMADGTYSGYASTSGAFPDSGSFSASPSTSGYAGSVVTANNVSTAGTYGQYPSAEAECQQAIVAAQYATNQSTRVFGVAYGSEQTGCYSTPSGGGTNTDTKFVLTTAQQNALTVPFSAVSSLSPCLTIENISSSMNYFYSDYLQSGSGVNTGCQATTNSAVTLNDIGLSIGAQFGTPALISNTAQ